MDAPQAYLPPEYVIRQIADLRPGETACTSLVVMRVDGDGRLWLVPTMSTRECGEFTISVTRSAADGLWEVDASTTRGFALEVDKQLPPWREPVARVKLP